MKTICLVIFTSFISMLASSQTTYTFTGNGNWSTPSNWSANTIPPNRLPSASTIIINPQQGDSCVLNIVHKNLPGSNFIVASGAKFIIPGGIGDYSDSAALVTKLKKVISPISYVSPLCLECPSIQRQFTDYYIYDSLYRLKTRKFITTTLSNVPITIDTATESINYFYDGSSNKIISYSFGAANIQLLYYDSLNRLIKDSTQNPSNNTGMIVRIYSYNLDTIFQTQSIINPSGFETLIDTMIKIGNNITFERIKYSSPSLPITMFNNFTFSVYRNPYSYVNNFSLLGSDYRSTSLLFTYNMRYSDRSTYNQVQRNDLQFRNNPIFISQFTIGLDAYGRVITSSNTYTGNAITTFEYY
jgi:hypothetical protein